MDPPAAAWAPPQQFDEYRLIKLLGQGSMGRVYLAQDTVLERAVAIKFITEADPEDRERFFVEARAAARLQHPNVVTVHRVGALDGHPFLITEFIRGKSLSELPLPLPWRKVLELGIGLARGLAAAHRHGVLHRDIKLANALLTETGEVKLLDFSLAKLFDPNTNDTTHRQPDLGAALDAATSAVERHEAEQSPRAKPLTADEGAPHAISSSQRMQAAAISASWLSETLSAPPGAPPPTPPPTPPSAGAAPPSSLTQVGTLLGTPNYMAPELWRAEPATRRSDVYALGVLLYILTSGWPPTEAATTVELATRIQREEPRPLLERAPRCDARLAAIVDRCLRRDPFERFAAGEDLLAALEALAPSTRELTIPEGNPYRGLQAFESQHRALFFGRSAEIRAVLERLRASPLVVVAGDSGVGKSSLCKAGVAPLVDEGQLGSSRQWSSVGITPGRYPFPTFVNALAELFDMSEEALGALARGPTDDLVRSLRKRLGEGRGRLLVIDQLEELATLADPTEAGLVGPLLARLASGIPGLRILATVRGDFLTRVAQIPELGDELARAIYILRPLSPEGAREAIVGPARVKGVGFESEELVQDLIRAGSRGSLPLMQFALAELWEIRDPLSPVITAAELRKIGGVSGALARHGDAVLAELIPEQRHAARRVLMRLVTVDDTRAVRSEDELTDGSPAAAAALKALVRSRLVVAREVAGKAVFEIAHEALLGGWATLSHWLDEARESRLLHHRLELAVTDWERLGRSRDVLWSGAQLQELLALDPAALRPREQDFLAASRAAAARARLLRRAAALAIPIVAVLTYGGVWLKGKLDLRGRVDALAAAAADDRAAAEAMLTDTERQRTEAFAAYDAGKTAEGEALWSAYVAKIPGAERQLARAAQQLETGLSLDPQRDDLREPLLDVLLRRALLAEELGRDAVTIDDHLERLRLHDRAGEHLARWDAPATLRVRSDPPGARAFLERYVDEDGRRRIRDVEALGVTPLDPLTRPRGSYRLRLELQDHAPVLYPVLLGRGETLDLELPLPRAEQVPAGFVFVPAGAFLYGSNDVEAMRRFMRAEPMHQVETGPYLIARHEVTFGDYIAFLEAQTPERRAEILKGWTDVVKLAERPGGGWRMTLNQGLRDYTAETGAELVYEGRTERARVMWEQLPVAGISPDEVHEFMRWLDQTGRVPGARLCDEREWERAARGADGRLFPTGDVLRPTDANFDETYGKVTSAFGPDPVGSYPHAESPFGLLDADGNIFELTASARQSGAYMVRGGGYYYAAIQARTSIRFDVASVYRNSSIGVRVCATWSASLR